MTQGRTQQLLASLKTIWHHLWQDLKIYTNSRLHSSNDIVGLVILYPFVKILKFRVTNSSLVVEHCALIPLPANTVAPKPILEILNISVIAALIQDRFAKLNIQTVQVACALNRSVALIKTFTINPALTTTEIEERAWLEANRLFPSLSNDIYIDFYPTNIINNETKKRDVILVVCRKDKIEPYVELARAANLQLRVLDVNCYALQRALILITPNYPNIKIFALLNIDFFSISLTIIENQNLIYSYETHYNGESLFEYYQAKYYQTTKPNLDSATDSSSSDIQTLLQQHLGNQITNTMQFFYSSCPTIRIEDIFVAGDCIYCIPDLPHFIATKIAKNTIVANPLQDLILPTKNQAELSRYSSAMMLACGLALSKPNPVETRI